MIFDLVFWFERHRTDSAVARSFDGERFHTGTGRDFLAAIADCIRERFESGMVQGPGLPPGRRTCPACSGDGGAFVRDTFAWNRCKLCGGIGQTWKPGGPRFDCAMELGERHPGEVVELATGDRALIAWHLPWKRARKERPTTTFVYLIDDFTDEPERTPIGVDSLLGIRSVNVKVEVVAEDLHDGEKDSDALDPFARRQRERGDALL